MQAPVIQVHSPGFDVGHGNGLKREVGTMGRFSFLSWNRVLSIAAALIAVLVMMGAAAELASASKQNRNELADKCRASGGTYYEYEYSYDLGGGWIESGIAFGCERGNGTIVHCDDHGVDNHGWTGGCNADWQGPLPPSSSKDTTPSDSDKDSGGLTSRGDQVVAVLTESRAAHDTQTSSSKDRAVIYIPTSQEAPAASEPDDTLVPVEPEPEEVASRVGGMHPQDTFESDCEARGGHVDRESSPGRLVCVGPGGWPTGVCDPNWGGECWLQDYAHQTGVGTSPSATDDQLLANESESDQADDGDDDERVVLIAEARVNLIAEVEEKDAADA